jgi:hypothetical protein
MQAITYDLAGVYPIDAEKCANYRRDGHILLQGVATPDEIQYYRPLITKIADECSSTRDVVVTQDETRPLLEYVSNVWQKSDEIREFVFAKRFARIAATLMGVKAVRLYHDEALVKEPGGYPTPWHKDHYSWPLATHHTIKMWIALVDIYVDMAAIRFASGTHRAGQFPEVPPSYEADQLFERIIRNHKIPVVSYVMHAGDACLYSGEVLHSTTGNDSGTRREALAVSYFADGTRVMKPNHEHRRVDMEEFLPGLKPDDPAASILNPLLYSTDD